MLIKLYKNFITNPKQIYRNIKGHSKVTNITVKTILLLAILFIIPNLIMILIKAKTPIPPLVIVPPDFFYHWILFIGIPAQIPLFIMTSGIFYLFTGKEDYSFKEVFCCITLGLSLPFFIYAVFEIVLAIYLLLSGYRTIPISFQITMYITMGITICGHIMFLYKLTRVVAEFRKLKSIIMSFVTTLIFWIFAGLFFG